MARRRPIIDTSIGRSSRIDPRRRVRGGDIFQRRAMKDALRAVEKGNDLSPLTRQNLGLRASDVASFRQDLAESLERSGRRVGGPFDNRNLTERRRGVSTDALGRRLDVLGQDADNRLRAGGPRDFFKRQQFRSLVKSGELGRRQESIVKRVFGLDDED